MSRAGFYGVYYHKKSGKWAAQIRLPGDIEHKPRKPRKHPNGRRKSRTSRIEWIGLFDSDALAARAYDARARELGKKKLNLVNPDDWKYFIKPED